jgi:hypothetical protein
MKRLSKAATQEVDLVLKLVKLSMSLAIDGITVLITIMVAGINARANATDILKVIFFLTAIMRASGSIISVPFEPT